MPLCIKFSVYWIMKYSKECYINVLPLLKTEQGSFIVYRYMYLSRCQYVTTNRKDFSSLQTRIYTLNNHVGTCTTGEKSAHSLLGHWIICNNLNIRNYSKVMKARYLGRKKNHLFPKHQGVTWRCILFLDRTRNWWTGRSLVKLLYDNPLIMMFANDLYTISEKKFFTRAFKI